MLLLERTQVTWENGGSLGLFFSNLSNSLSIWFTDKHGLKLYWNAKAMLNLQSWNFRRKSKNKKWDTTNDQLSGCTCIPTWNQYLLRIFHFQIKLTQNFFPYNGVTVILATLQIEKQSSLQLKPFNFWTYAMLFCNSTKGQHSSIWEVWDGHLPCIF